MSNYTCPADQYSNIYEFLEDNPQIKVGDTIDYVTPNQAGQRKYMIILQDITDTSGGKRKKTMKNKSKRYRKSRKNRK